MPKKSRRTTSDRKILEEIKERYKKFREIIEIIKKDEKEKDAQKKDDSKMEEEKPKEEGTKKDD